MAVSAGSKRYASQGWHCELLESGNYVQLTCVLSIQPRASPLCLETRVEVSAPRERGHHIPSVCIAFRQGAASLNEIFQGDTINKVDPRGAALIPSFQSHSAPPSAPKGSVEPPGMFGGTKFENQRCCLRPPPVLPRRDHRLETGEAEAGPCLLGGVAHPLALHRPKSGVLTSSCRVAQGK